MSQFISQPVEYNLEKNNNPSKAHKDPVPECASSKVKGGPLTALFFSLCFPAYQLLDGFGQV